MRFKLKYAALSAALAVPLAVVLMIRADIPAEELKAIAPDLLKKPPTIEKIDVLAAKIPEHTEVPDSLG